MFSGRNEYGQDSANPEVSYAADVVQPFVNHMCVKEKCMTTGAYRSKRSLCECLYFFTK